MRRTAPTVAALVVAAILLFLAAVASQADAQTVPSYTDASTGLPTADLWVSKLVFFDIDGDGDLDLLSLGPRKGDEDRNLHVWKWSGSGWIHANAEEGTSQIGHSSYGGFAFADFDNDGDWDIGAGSHGANDVNAYRKISAATYIDSSIGLDTAEDAWNIDFGDFNSDGNMDLLETGFWGMDVRPFAGSGYGTWLDSRDGLPDGHSRVEGYFCDFTNDGDLDIVASWGYGDWVYLGDGNGTWTNSSDGLPGGSVGYGAGIACGDFNDDGYHDIVMSVGGQTKAFAGDGTGNWTEVSVGLPAYHFSSIVLADMNNDGYEDIVGMVPSDPGVVEIYHYSGFNSWTKADMTTMQGNAKGYRVAVGDFDNNGYMDIAGGFGTDDVAGYPGSIKVWRESSTPSDLGVTLLFPDGGEMFKQGSAWFVRWISTVPSTATGVEIDLEYSTEGDDGPWTSIASGLPNSGIYQWKVPDEESDDCYLRITISDAQGNSASDINDAPFGIGRTPGGGGGREPHDPIQINSDAEWTPANGVRRGTGTETDPYIIERWDIRGDDSTCISITNTRAYAVIRDCHLHNTTGLRQGIYLKNAENITIEDNDIDHTHHGVNTESAEYRLLDNRIVDIEARGVMVVGGDNRITAIGNTLRNTGVYGFNLDGGGGVTHQGYWKYPALLENNTISGAVYGIYLNTATGTFRRNRVFGCGYGVHCTIGMTWDRAVNATFVDNVFTHNQFGAYVALLREDVDGHPYWAILRDNRFERNTFRGLWLSAGAEYTVENNTFALNPLGIDSLASGVQTFRNNTVMYNLGGIYLREKYGPGASDGITIEDNDILNNAYFGVRNDDAHAPGRVAGNYLGGTPGDDGDRLEGPIVGTFASTPNDPDTPDVAGNVTVIDAGTSVVIDSDTTLRCHYFVRKGGGLTIRGATVDMDGMWIAAKIGARLNITSSTLLDGLTVAVSTDLAEIVNSTFDGLVAGISVYRASPEINNCTVRNENGSYQPGAHSSKTKVVLEPAGIYLNGDTARIRGGRIETGGAFGVFAIGSTARIENLTVLGNAWGVAARSGNLSLVDCGIRSCSQAGITNYDGWWHYGNLSITIDGCRLDDNEIGIELPVGEVGGTGTPHDIRIVDTTVSGGTTGLALEVDGAEIICSTFDRNGLIIDGSDLLFSGNTVSGGYGLVLHGYGLHLDNNTFNSNSRGLQVRDSSPIVVNNDFTQNRYGVYAEDKAQPKLRYNNFENNLDYGVYNDDSSTLINATLNWWNSATGPGGEGNGSGDAVSKYVAFTPWLLSESDHNGHYENVPPDPPTVSLPSTAALWFRLRGATQDPEGDIIRSVEVRVRNDTFDTGWLPANASWRDVRSRGRYAHIVDALGLAGRYEVSVRCHDGNDPSPVVTRDITVNVTSFEEHAPIVIVGDAGFTAANGVRSGSGTATDPYIIEGWDISSNDSASISISNTTAHVVIRLCHIHGNRSNDGIAVAHSRNVRIERCRLVDNDHGITVYQEGRVEIEGCLINGSGSADVYTRDSLVNVTGSAFWNGRYSLDMAGGPEIPLTVARSTFVGGVLYLIDLNVTVRDCLMTGGQVIGGSVGGEGEYLFNITGNVMSHGVAGVWFNHGTVNVTRNLIVDNVWAAWGDRSNMTLRDNNMFGNDRGVENGDDSTTIDARYNWWGAANGPSGQGSGDGDPAGDNVDFDPWLDRPVVFNEDPTIRVLEPDGRNDTVDDRFVIRWNATDPDGDAVSVSLYWDGDDVPRGGHLIADGLPAAGSYEWDVSGLEEGEYHVMGIAEDDCGGVGSAYGDGPVTVDHPPSITVLDPPSGDHDADANYTIRWETANASADSTIDIYRDDDTDPSEGLEPVETGLGDNGSYEWDLSSIGEGYYYVYCVVREGDWQAGAYSDGRVHIVHGNGSGDQTPWIEVLEPDGGGDRADRSYTVRWEAGDDDGDTLTIALYYDTDTNPSEGTTLIASGLGNTGSHRWNTTGVDEGEYYIYAIVDDGNGSQATDYSPGTVRVEHGGGPENHPPALEVIEPDGDNDRADRSYTIRWNATDQDGDTIIMSLYYDEDTDAGSGRTLIASGLGNTGSYAWDTSGVPEGAYYIHAIVDDGNGSSTSDYSPGRVTITHPGEGENHDPRVTIERPADRSTVSGTVTVSGRASDEDGNDNIVSVRVRIGDGNWVEAEGTTDWTFSWDTTGWPNGPVTVRVMAEDSEGATGTDRITVTVENPTDPPWIRILSPLDSDTVGGTVVIGGTAGGGADLDWVTVAVDGMELEAPDPYNWTVAWDSTDIELGNVTITATARDVEGRTASASITVTIDNRAANAGPPVLAVMEAPTRVRRGEDALFSLTIVDPDGIDDVVSMHATLVDGTGAVVLEIPGTGLDWRTGTVYLSVPTEGLKGTYVLRVVAVDSAGTNATVSLTFVVGPREGGGDGDRTWAAMVAVGSIVLLAAVVVGIRRRGRPSGSGPESIWPVTPEEGIPAIPSGMPPPPPLSPPSASPASTPTTTATEPASQTTGKGLRGTPGAPGITYIPPTPLGGGDVTAAGPGDGGGAGAGRTDDGVVHEVEVIEDVKVIGE